MAKFCGKCGSKLDETTGLCPKCDAEKLINLHKDSEHAPREDRGKAREKTPQNIPLNKIDAKAAARKQKKSEKKSAKKAKKAAKRTAMTTGQKTGRFILKLLTVLLVLAVLVAGIAGVLIYFDVVDIPVASNLLDKVGIGSQPKDEPDEFNTLTGKFTDIRVVDEASAIAAAQDAATLLGLGNAADELTVKNISTVDGITYYRLQQNYKGIPVYERTMVVMSDARGEAVGYSTNAIDLNNISFGEIISQDQINLAIENYFIANEGLLTDTEVIVETASNTNLAIYTFDNKIILIYALQVFFNDSPISFKKAIINAMSGEVISIETTIYEEKATCYSSNSTIEVSGYFDEISNEYQLFDTDRGLKIYSYENTNSRSENNTQTFITSQNDVFGDTTEEADLEQTKGVTLLYNVSKIKDFYYTNCSDNGFEISFCYYNDAFYSGNNALGGTANSLSGELVGYLSMGSVTGVDSIDTIGHEYTHIISRKIVEWSTVDTSAGATDEPGAINEGYSDIFGELIEGAIDGTTPDWEHGSRIIHDPLSNGYPAAVGDKAYKKETTSDGKTGWYMRTKGNGLTDYSHGFSTIISHCAYLMYTGIDGSYSKLSSKELSNLWYNTLYTLPSNCTFVVLRKNMEMTADILGFSDEKKQCISASFDKAGIESQGSGEETYSTDATLSVIDKNGEPYNDYTITISGKKYGGLFKTGLFKSDYSKKIVVTNSNSVALNLSKGDYTITVSDNFNKTLTEKKSVKIRSSSKLSDIIVATSFGFDYTIRSNAQLSVFDMNNQLYGNYTIKINGTYTNSEGTKTSYNDSLTIDSIRTADIKLSDGKYSFLLVDTLDAKKTRSITVKVQSLGATDMKVSTNFGVKAGQFDIKDLPKDAVEFNGHYYYIYKDEKSWSEASKFCESNNGYLVTITSQQEQDFVYNYVEQVASALAAVNESGEVEHWEKEIWIGATDARFEGEWEWANGERFSYTNWAIGQPDDYMGQDYGVILSYLHKGDSYRILAGQWDDSSAYSCPYICEWGEYITESAETDIESPSKRTTSDERDIVLVLDTSGSMSGTPINETRKASIKFIESVLKEKASIGIVTYSSSADLISDFSMNEDSLVNNVNAIGSGGGTNTESGLQMAYDLLQYSNARKRLIILMSDGEPNEGKEGDALVSYADEIKDSGIFIYTLGFFESLGGDKSSAQDLMERIASDGCHYEVANADDLVFFFNDVADQINGQGYIYVRIACPVDVTVTYGGQTLSSSEDDLNTRTDFGSLSFEQSNEIGYDSNDDRIKVLRLKDGAYYDINIVGTGRGIMSYTIGFMDGNGEYSDFRTFENVKITKQTVISTVAGKSDKTTLLVDSDGDGKYNLRLQAKENGYGKEVKQTQWLYIFIGAFAIILIIAVAMTLSVRRKRRDGR